MATKRKTKTPATTRRKKSVRQDEDHMSAGAKPSRTQKPPKYTPERARAFCIILADTCNVGKSAESIGVTRKTVYDWKEKYPNFSEAWDAAKAIGVSVLEDEAVRRAGEEGVKEPVYYKGRVVGTVRKHSDTLLAFLLSAHKPEKYGKQRHELSAPDGKPLVPARIEVVFVDPAKEKS